MKRTLTAVSLFLFLTLSAVAETATTQRLATLGRVWGFVKHAHPYIGTGVIPWDEAGVRAISRTMTATDAEGFALAVQEMLEALSDPATLVERTCVESGTPPERTPVVTGSGSLYVPPGATVDAQTIRTHANVVFDLRPRPGRCSSANAALLETLAPLMFSGSIAPSLRRAIGHDGYHSQHPDDAEWSPYSTSYSMPAMPPFVGTAIGTRTTTFVVDEQSALPDVAAAMVQAGLASVVSVGPYRDAAMTWRTIPLEGGYHARIRTTEAPVTIHARTAISAAATEEDILAAAAAEPRTAARRRTARAIGTTMRYVQSFDDPYTDMKFPDVEYRVLAAYRYWNAIEYFYPYKHLIDPWHAQLEPMIETMLAPTSRTEYELALAALTKFVPDGHSYAFTAARSALLGPGGPPFQTMPVEGKVVVTAITNAEAAAAAGIRLGDELLSIDGRPVEERIAELKRYMSSANDAHLEYGAVSNAPRGGNGTQATMRFRRPDGGEYEATVQRSIAWRVPPPPARNWQMLPDNIGYVDLSYLEIEQVDEMFRDLGGARAIIFDMRGYPRGVFAALARRMNITGSTVVAQIRIPRVVAGVVSESFSLQNLPKNPTPSFKGKTIMLIDERAQSQAEHTGLVLEAVANATFVGSPTSGSNGNVTQLVAPGGNYIMFTGMDVRHADGRQLQRIGLVPHVPVPRTLAGVAAGRDEVLEAAIALAKS
ncbi:MAG TPA: S41 family peptidase [Thermoanaerobaculia bacterium]|jgi:C-terminal processing protease CtpA/Prc